MSLRMTIPVRIAVFLVAAVSAVFSAADASAWWNEEWQYRRQIALDTSEQGLGLTQELGSVTVLVKLHGGNFDFTRTREDGGDLRFVDATDKTPLKFRPAMYSAIDEMAFFWVQIPNLKANSAENSIYLYYGNPKAAAGAPATDVFDTSHALVLLLDEMEGLPADVSMHANAVGESTVSPGIPAVVGAGVSLFGQEWISVTPSASLDFANGFTFTVWFRTADANVSAELAGIGGEGVKTTVGLDNGDIVVDLAGEEIRATPATPVSANEWHHLAVAAGAGNAAVYLDGAQVTTSAFVGKLPGPQSAVVIGGGEGAAGFAGELDEIRLSTLARPADWIRAEYAGAGPQAALAQVGPEGVNEAGGAMPVLYFGTIVENISLDGWVIIAVLAVFSLASWIVLMGKTFFLLMNKKDNSAFLKEFHSDHEVRSCIDDDVEFQNSTLYRVYRAGCKDLRLFLYPGKDAEGNGSAEPAPLSGRDLSAFRTRLENGYLHEVKKLNGWLGILVAAISGGPFLGLLGTVWGVMNTFAAMAEAGEANIMAIAPGVASALATTVVGLLVAIPASFGYNYLLATVKEITTDLAVFVEEFVVDVERKFGAEA
ncbi:MAG: DUF2341 domain-containing protein [Thermodesulfobacteriota bacterium]